MPRRRRRRLPQKTQTAQLRRARAIYRRLRPSTCGCPVTRWRTLRSRSFPDCFRRHARRRLRAPCEFRRARCSPFTRLRHHQREMVRHHRASPAMSASGRCCSHGDGRRHPAGLRRQRTLTIRIRPRAGGRAHARPLVADIRADAPWNWASRAAQHGRPRHAAPPAAVLLDKVVPTPRASLVAVLRKKKTVA